MCCCNLFASILLKIFVLVFIMGICLKFCFIVESLLGLGIRMMLVSLNELGGFLPFVLFHTVSEGVEPAPLSTSDRIQLWTCLDLDFFWLVGYWLLPLLQPLLLVYSGFQLPPGLVLVEYKCLGIYPFLPGLLVYVNRTVSSNLWW